METRTVKTLRIFLASSSELKDDRVAFADFIMRLKKHYEKRNYDFQLEKWEYLNPAYNNRRKQDEYNQVIKESDSFVALFHSKAGDYTVEEFDIAIQECRKRELPLLIYFKDLKGKREPVKLKKLKNRIANELEHYWGSYDSSDQLHLDFALWLDNHLFGIESELKVENGEITMGGVPVAQMSQLQFAANNKVFMDFENRLEALDQDIAQAREDIKQYPQDERFSKRLSQKTIERDQLLQDFERRQQLLLSTAKHIAELKREQIGERIQQAIDAFEAGDMDKANAILDVMAREADDFNDNFEKNREQMHNYIEGFRLQTKTVLAKEDTPIDERIARVHDIYAKADDWAGRSAYDEVKYAKLLLDYADFLSDYGLYKVAEQIYLRQIAMSEKIYGQESEDIATSYNNIGSVYWVQSDFKKALEYYFKAMKIREQVLGKEHPDTATPYNNIGSVYHNQGDFKKALEYHFKALKIREQVLGKEHPNTATSYNNIGGVYKAQGDFKKALDYYFKALKICEQVLGKQHTNTAASYNNIGAVYNAQGDYKKALEYYFKDLKICEQVLGKQHPDTATSYNNIGNVYHDQGDFKKALEYHFKALKIREQVLGKEHPNTAYSYNNIGTVYNDEGDFKKALEYHFKALKIREQVLGNEHPDTAMSYNNIGMVYHDEGDFQKALEYFMKALDILMDKLGENHPNTMTVKNNIKAIQRKMMGGK